MGHESIGTARRPDEGITPEEGVTFNLPYGETGYAITLSNPEMDRLLQASFQKLLGNRALAGFDYIVELPDPDLPLFIGARSISVEDNPCSFHNVNIAVSVVTQSYIYEHRGILLANRRGGDGSWSFVDYEAQPPLREWPPENAPRPRCRRRELARRAWRATL